MSSDRQKAFSRPNLRLVAHDGHRLDQVAPASAPEAIMYVSFQGLTESEQRAALGAFPGGQRFRLVPDQATATLKFAGR